MTSQDRYNETTRGAAREIMKKTPTRTLEDNQHKDPQKTYNRFLVRGSHINIQDHHQTLLHTRYINSDIAKQRDYVEDNYDLNEAYDAYSQQYLNRFINSYNKHRVTHNILPTSTS